MPSPPCAGTSLLHFSTSCIIDATVGYPSGVWYSPFLYVTARPATEARVTALF